MNILLGSFLIGQHSAGINSDCTSNWPARTKGRLTQQIYNERQLEERADWMENGVETDLKGNFWKFRILTLSNKSFSIFWQCAIDLRLGWEYIYYMQTLAYQVGRECFVSFSRSSDILLSKQLILSRAEMTFF